MINSNFSSPIGWIILLVGLGIIGWTLINSYNIFTARAELPEFFSFSAENYEEPAEAPQLQQMIEEQLKGILPADSMTKLLNLVVWSMLAFILIFGGSKISGLGIKLIHPVK